MNPPYPPASMPLLPLLCLALPLVSSLVTLLDPRVMEKISSNPRLLAEDKRHLLTLLQGLSGAYTENKGVDWKVLFRVGRRQGEKARRERERNRQEKKEARNRKKENLLLHHMERKEKND